MIIDFHTHIFPDKIASRTIDHLSSLCGVPPSIDGTKQDLLRSMDKAGIDLSVVLPVVTNPAHFNSVQQFAAEVNSHQRLISFGGIHPDCDDIEQKLNTIVQLGLPGIKLHPDYQGTYADDPRYMHIVREAIRRNLIVLYHAGVDIGLPEVHYSAPDRFVRLLDELQIDSQPDAKIVLAHTGGFQYWEDVYNLLAGRNVYFDLSFTAPYASDEMIMSIIHRHGTDRILFGTDCPWKNQKEYLAHIRSLPLSTAQMEDVLGKNAAKLLDLTLADHIFEHETNT